MHEIAQLIADLAEAIREIELGGGGEGGNPYVTWNWKKRLSDIAEKAKTLADHYS